MYSLKVTNLRKEFQSGDGRVTAVNGINFEVQRGEFFTLLGPSGCGKTTTLRCVAGLEKPTGGQIFIGDKIVFDADSHTYIPPDKRPIGMVFQSYAIWPHFTVYQNVAYPLEVKKLPKKEIKERVMRSLEIVGLDDKASRPAPRLSGGQQQRVALARAIVSEPEILLLDEPLSNLDAKLRQQMRLELKQLINRVNLTAIYVTHDQEEALSLSDRIALMSDGNVMELGAPGEIYHKPNHPFTATFLGAANLLDGTVLGAEGGLVSIDTKVGKLRVACENKVQNGSNVHICIRPEGFDMTVEKEAVSGLNCFTGLVENLAFLGDSVDYEIRVGNTILKVKSTSFLHAERGDKVSIHITPERCRVIPA